ncbi:MAG: glycosyltransferase family 2 protein [Amylibacter sp.]
MLPSVPRLKIVSNQSDAHIDHDISRLSIGRVLLSKNWVTEGDLLKAWSIQRVEAAPIGEILIGMGTITIDQLYQALAVQHGLELVNFETRPPSMNWATFSDAQTSLQQGFVIWRNTDHNLTIAITDPNNMATIRKSYQHLNKSVSFMLVKPTDLQRFITLNQGRTLQEAALNYCPKTMSCQSWSRWKRSNVLGLAAFISVIGASIFAPLIALSTTLVCVLIALMFLMGFRLLCLFALRKPFDAPDEPLKTIKRPKVSIMVPLFKESAIIDRLLGRLQALAYPRELLEICFIHEEKDYETKAALDRLNLPYNMKTIEIPCGQLQTKPRAMNYALDFCSGSIIGIYDAEDAPEVNQIEQIVQKFATSDKKVACIQCVLDFYNTDTNWMSRCFTVEYAILFRLILPALDKLKLPIPLGGTSVFFRRDILEKLGRWDAYNVTEDADLGFRLYRMGYRCSWINAVTYEEANYRIIPWVKQRSRWLKGFFLTAHVHLRNPVKLQNEIGTRAVMAMFCLMVVPWIISPLVPIILPMWILSFGLDLPFYSDLPNWFTNTLITAFISTELMSLYLGYKVSKTKQHKHLRAWLLTTIFYWPIACFASYKALFEIFTRPAYWDKSEHGLNDKNYTNEIRKLTSNSGKI